VCNTTCQPEEPKQICANAYNKQTSLSDFFKCFFVFRTLIF
jgi:hypothetical protein